MVLEHKTKEEILAMNRRISEILTNNEERTVKGEEEYDKTAKRIWNEVKKELLEQAKAERFASRHIASMERSPNGRILVIFHRRSSEELKSYDIRKEMDVNRIFIRMALLAEKTGFSIEPSHQMGVNGRISWWIQFTEAKSG